MNGWTKKNIEQWNTRFGPNNISFYFFIPFMASKQTKFLFFFLFFCIIVLYNDDDDDILLFVCGMNFCFFFIIIIWPNETKTDCMTDLYQCWWWWRKWKIWWNYDVMMREKVFFSGKIVKKMIFFLVSFFVCVCVTYNSRSNSGQHTFQII